MANEYYERLSEMNPGDLADGLAMEAEFDAISLGFSKLPTPHTGGQGFDGPVRVGDAVNSDEAVNLGQLNAAIGEAVLLPIATYGNLSSTAWETLPSNTYLLFGTGAQLSNTPYTLVAGSTYYLQVRHVIGGAGVSIYHDQLSLTSSDDVGNVDLRRLFVRTGSTFANANAGGWAGFTLKKAALTALESLTPAADKLPFFNGPKGAGVATFTALARTLLAGATDADMRGTLKVPGLYIGNEANMDFDTLTEPGIYRLGPSPLHGPSATADGRYSQVAVDRANTDTLTQAVAIYLTGELWVRTALFTGGVWVFQPWRKQFDTKNILGAVSQSGGIPTGAIFERVSNANGEGLKLPDGTLICWRTYTDTAHTTAANGAVFYKAMIGIAKPVTFVGAAVDFQAAIYRAGDTTMLRWVGNRGNSLTLSEWNFDSITAAAVTNVSASFMLISFGRWY